MNYDTEETKRTEEVSESDSPNFAEGTDQASDALPQLNIGRLTVRTLFWCVVAGVLLFTCFLNFFSYPAMRFYTNLNLKDRALTSAERYLSRHESEYTDIKPTGDSKFADAVLLTVENSVYLMNNHIMRGGYADSKALYYADKTDGHITRYLSYNITGSMGDRSELKDTYNRRHTEYYKHPWLSIYSFTNYLRVMQYRAQLLENKQDELYADHTNITTGSWDNASWEVPAGTALDDIFVMMAQLTEYIRSELTALGFYDLTPDAYGWYDAADIATISYNAAQPRPFSFFIEDGTRLSTVRNDFTPLYNRLNAKCDDFKDYLQQYMVRTGHDKMLPYIYYTGILRDFTQSMLYMSQVVYANARFYNDDDINRLRDMQDDWLRHFAIAGETLVNDAGQVTYTASYLNDWYAKILLPQYRSLLANQIA